MSTSRVAFCVNGEAVEIEVEDRTTLADALRQGLRLTGTHLGCEHGVCGACTVLVDGQPARSCLMFAIQAQDCDLVTVEGVPERAPELIRALSDAHSFQCGFCTPGFVVTAYAMMLEADGTDPDDAQLRELLAGNLCRCTGYQSIIDGVRCALAPVTVNE